MTYAPPGSGLGSAQEKKVEASLRLKKSLTKSADSTPTAAEALARKKYQDDIRAEHKANQERLRKEYEAARPKPHPSASGYQLTTLGKLLMGDSNPISQGQYYHELEQDGAFDA